MRKLLLLLCVSWLAWPGSETLAIDSFDDQEDGWSWRDGLLGDGSRRGDVFADERYPGYLCEECRDPYEHPMDFVALAYNGYFGDDPWMWESQLGMPFRIYNLDMQWVVVWIEGIFFDSLTFLPDTLDIRVRLPNGQILTFQVLQDGPDLPIGDPNPEAEATDSCGSSGGGEGEDGYGDPDAGLPEPEDPPEPTGVVSLVDPDEDGEFPEWEL